MAKRVTAVMDPVTWRGRILGGVRDLADEAYQERVWVRGEGPEVDSPTEALCRLLDDYDLAGFLDRAAAEGWLAPRQLTALQALARALDGVAAGDGLAGAPWQRVRRLAAQALAAFAPEGAVPLSRTLG